MSKREKNSVNATEKSGDKANMRANGTSKNNKHSTDNSGYAVSGQAKEDDRRTGDGDEKRKRDGSNYNTNINSRQKLAVTRSTNTIQSISVKASSLRAVQSNGTAPERDSGDAGLDVNKQAVHGVRENLAPTPSGGVGAGHNITPAAESIGSGVVEEEDEDEVYTTALKGATLSASGCDDQKTTTQPLKGQTTTAVTPLEALISHADTSMSKKASVDSGLYMEESQDTLPSLKQTKPKYGKTKHLPISNHHITAQQKTGTSRERELPLRKTQSSLGLATGIMHISDRVPTSYDKKAKSFYAQSEPGLSSAKIAPSTKNRERRKSERTSTKNSHKVSHARRRLTDDSGPAQARRRTMTRSNSCSTLFVEQTVSNPDLDNILRCMAIAFHLQFLRLQREVNRPRTSATVALRQPASNMNDSSDALFLDSQSKRSTAKHVSTARGKPSSHKHSREATHSRVRSGGFDSLGPQRFDAHVALPEFPSEFDEMKHPLTSRRVPSIYSKVIPSASDTYDFLRALFSAALLKSEVAIVSMVYISRLSDQGGVALQPANWKRVLLGACMLASKVWDDQAVWNTDFCDVLPDVAVTDMNALERVVLEKLAYDVSVTPAQYVEHYLALRDYGVAADLHDGRDLPALTTGNNDFLSRPSSREFLDDTKKTQLLHTHSSEDLLGDGNAALLEMPIRDWSQSRPV
ncbi:hypothetical protein SARC_04613 [Sphaeroforma arctica JP610]|uniref:Cyclin N-terminal domain-containing protein n=1 Tax=Sphaeroforma arctica JP610 TaxID=667725 RepID=A0A0L0G217_9EUKA|nr:hypothetical protein SARC_04613 [Sphaeroforma arctica JP610]KNC83115.1 hypothetical protein SARC_04613 [Sphaeroforma arctica JP610]|eukprot:XP_014157017.1 hypothetical protein SARC_04613 [Sphaeroforma arctica JP610]